MCEEFYENNSKEWRLQRNQWRLTFNQWCLDYQHARSLLMLFHLVRESAGVLIMLHMHATTITGPRSRV